MSTYTPIATQTLGSAASSVIFSRIPQGYTDLVIVFIGSVPSGSGDLGLRFNFDTGSNYSHTWFSSQAGGIGGRSASANSISTTEYAYLDSTNNTLSTINLLNYSNSTTYKGLLARSGKANYATETKVGLWRNTSAITSVTIFTTGSNPNFATTSTFSIYGIQAGNKDQKATGGNIVTTDGTYMYHAFTSSGAFIPSQALTADVLVVAGGASGGNNTGGGGGAGGLQAFASQSFTSISYPVTIGAGGASVTADGNAGNAGSDSSFNSNISTGGGGGGRNFNGGATAGATGGSGGGGGGGDNGSGTTTGGAGNTPSKSPAQGFAGGNGQNTSNQSGGGGGGAGAVGTNAPSGNGGAGTNTHNSINFSTWLTATSTGVSGYLAGGGGGGAGSGAGGSGGSGGGGNSTAAGNPGAVGGSGTTNTGSGGAGGGWNNSYSGAGGSGIVIIRYLL